MSPAPSPPPDAPPEIQHRWTRLACLTAGLLFAAGFVLRLSTVLLSGGIRGTSGFDAGVYYASADALDHGLMPYRDYVLLHPPGISLMLTPFAEVGVLIGDHRGYMLATLAWMALGSLNSVLVWRVATWMGVGRIAAFGAGMFYSVGWVAAGSEFSIRLEPLGNTMLLLGLLAWARAEAVRDTGGVVTRRLALVSGAGFGAACAVKIWWAAPLVLLVAWHVSARRRRELPWVLAGAATALLAVLGPFFAAAPRQMWSMVVLEQLGRVSNGAPLVRLLGITGLEGTVPSLEMHPARAWTAIVVIGVGAVALCLRAWSARGGPFVVALLILQLLVLTLGPSWFSFYADFTAPAAALVFGAALRPRPASRRVEWPAEPAQSSRTLRGAIAGVVAMAVVLLGLDVARPPGGVVPFPHAALQAGIRGVDCLVSDAPIVQIELNTLSPGLRRGCPNWIDVSGRTYGIDREVIAGRTVARAHNLRWQRDLRRYLFAGDAVILYRPGPSGVGPALRHALQRQRVTARAGPYTVYRIRSARLERKRISHLSLP